MTPNRPLEIPLACLALALLLPASARAAQTIRVAAGGSIAEALERAAPGSVIEVEPGVYREALTVDTNDITLRGIVRGAERPVLDGFGELNDGVIASGSPFAMTGFRVQHYKGNGVSAQGVDGVFLSDLVIDDTGLYGVYPVQSRNVTVTHCTVTRIRDAAIYVGESNVAVVAYNEVFTNVAGIEIENTNDADVHDNLVYGNTAGVLVFVLPNKVQKHGRRSRVFRNWVLRNNTPNFGDPEAIVGQLPEGLGLMVMGADDTVLEDNWVKGNASAGIAILRLDAQHADKDPELEPFSDRTQVRFNHVSENGAAPNPELAKRWGGGGDLAWDGTGAHNCADLPDPAIRVAAPLPSCLEGHAAAATAPPAPSTSPARSAAPARIPEGSQIVHIRGMRFEPRHLKIARGQTVTWVNEDAVTHTVTSGEGTTPTLSPLQSPFLAGGESYSHTFAEAGRYEYLCLPHLDQAPMRGATVTVE
jgi:parallel beta-helix repeat protein